MRCQICNRKINPACEETDLEIPQPGNASWLSGWLAVCDRCYNEYDRGLRVKTREAEPYALGR